MLHAAQHRTLRQRHWALFAIRAIALLMMICAVVLILRAITSAYGMSRGGGSFFFHLIGVFHTNNYNAFWHGVSFGVPGIALAWWSRAAARWLAPAVANECPSCGYALTALRAARCPECGYTIASNGTGSGPA